MQANLALVLLGPRHHMPHSSFFPTHLPIAPGLCCIHPRLQIRTCFRERARRIFICRPGTVANSQYGCTRTNTVHAMHVISWHPQAFKRMIVAHRHCWLVFSFLIPVPVFSAVSDHLLLTQLALGHFLILIPDLLTTGFLTATIPDYAFCFALSAVIHLGIYLLYPACSTYQQYSPVAPTFSTYILYPACCTYHCELLPTVCSLHHIQLSWVLLHALSGMHLQRDLHTTISHLWPSWQSLLIWVSCPLLSPSGSLSTQ